jgi:hypothetical protein
MRRQRVNLSRYAGAVTLLTSNVLHRSRNREYGPLLVTISWSVTITFRQGILEPREFSKRPRQSSLKLKAVEDAFCAENKHSLEAAGSAA